MNIFGIVAQEPSSRAWGGPRGDLVERVVHPHDYFGSVIPLRPFRGVFFFPNKLIDEFSIKDIVKKD